MHLCFKDYQLAHDGELVRQNLVSAALQWPISLGSERLQKKRGKKGKTKQKTRFSFAGRANALVCNTDIFLG